MSKSAPTVVGSVTFAPGTGRGQLPSERFAAAIGPTMFDQLAAAANRSIHMSEQLVRNLAAQVKEQANEIHCLNAERNEAIYHLIQLYRDCATGPALEVVVGAYLKRLGLDPDTRPVRTRQFIADFEEAAQLNSDRQEGGQS